jgi:nucleotide-binding universal stress UspA family protein
MTNYLITLDFSPLTPDLVATACGLAKSGDRLILVHVAPPEPDFIPYSAGPASVREVVGKELREEHRQLLEQVSELQQQGWESEGHMVQGPTVPTLVELAEKYEADYVIAGTRGHGKWHQWLVGSTTEALLKKLSVPLLVVPPRRDPPA